jgi:hypothetical protein
MRAVTIPLDEPLSFGALRRLNPDATVAQLSDAFELLPAELKAEAWAQMRLRVALEVWGGDDLEVDALAD